MARAMMDEGKVLNTFLGEVAQVVIYLANKTKLRPNSDESSYELSKGR